MPKRAPREPKVDPLAFEKVSFETFRKPGHHAQDSLTAVNPYCFNGIVGIQRYRVTFELIEEPVEVLQERLRKLWRETDNYHHRGLLGAMAERLGFELQSAEFGKDRKP